MYAPQVTASNEVTILGSTFLNTRSLTIPSQFALKPHRDWCRLWDLYSCAENEVNSPARSLFITLDGDSDDNWYFGFPGSEDQSPSTLTMAPPRLVALFLLI